MKLQIVRKRHSNKLQALQVLTKLQPLSYKVQILARQWLTHSCIQIRAMTLRRTSPTAFTTITHYAVETTSRRSKSSTRAVPRYHYRYQGWRQMIPGLHLPGPNNHPPQYNSQHSILSRRQARRQLQLKSQQQLELSRITCWTATSKTRVRKKKLRITVHASTWA